MGRAGKVHKTWRSAPQATEAVTSLSLLAGMTWLWISLSNMMQGGLHVKEVRAAAIQPMHTAVITVKECPMQPSADAGWLELFLTLLSLRRHKRACGEPQACIGMQSLVTCCASKRTKSQIKQVASRDG